MKFFITSQFAFKKFNLSHGGCTFFSNIIIRANRSPIRESIAEELSKFINCYNKMGLLVSLIQNRGGGELGGGLDVMKKNCLRLLEILLLSIFHKVFFCFCESYKQN